MALGSTDYRPEGFGGRNNYRSFFMNGFSVILFSVLVSSSAFAMNCKTSSCESANAVMQVLESPKTPAQARDLLIRALNGPLKKSKVAILKNEVADAAAGTIYRSIQVGVEDLAGDDEGYSFVYEILVKTVDGAVKNVQIKLIAG